MKTDARVRYTKKVLRESLFQCLKKKGSLKAVTVKEVCELADLNRPTFYRHYKDCFDLVEQLENEEIQEFREIFENGEDTFSRNFAVGIVDLLNKYDDLIEAYADGSIDGNLKEKMVQAAYELCIGSWKEHLPKGKEQEIEMLFSAASASFFQLVITERGKRPVEETLAFMYKFLRSGLQQFL